MTTQRQLQSEFGPGEYEPAPPIHMKAEADEARIAYIMSRFPKITETFILYEILELQRQGFSVGIFPLLRQQERVTHPEVSQLADRVRYTKFVSIPALRANLHYLVRRPGRYARMLLKVLMGTIGHPPFFIKSLLIVPKCALLAREMELNGYRHVHAHFATHPALAALIIKMLTDIPFSFTGHGSDIHKSQHMLDTKILEAAFVVTISRYNVEFLAEKFGDKIRNNMQIVRCGIDTQQFSAKDRISDGKTLRILCVASFREVKGHKYLLDACRLLSDRGISFECHLVGDGKLRRDLSALVADLGLVDKVIFHGARDRPYVIQMMQDSDVAVLTSIRGSAGNREGVPVTLMEAMAMELPVVSSQLSGIPELVEPGVTGILTRPGDSSAIADALEQLSRNAEMRIAMGKAGREKVLREFDQTRTVAKLAELFRNAS